MVIDMKEKVSLYYNQITVRLQSDHNQLQSVTSSFTSWKHPVQAVPQKKKKKKRRRNKAKEKERMKRRRKKGTRWKRGEEEKGMERVCSEGKRKGKMRGGRKDEEEGEGEGKEKEKEK